MLERSRLAEAVRSEGGVSRRLFMAYCGALASLPRLAQEATADTPRPKFPADPFTLGVASGDPDASSVVLWTKLAPDPLRGDGGMEPHYLPVQWQVSEDEGFKKVVAEGSALATPQLGHSVHAVASGLKPHRWYFYRFRCGDAVSPIGRTRTLPAPDQPVERLQFAFASCQHYEHGYYTAYAQMAKDEPDLVFHLGDYIYEYPYREKARLVRKHTGPRDRKIQTLDEYRERHALYRSDPLLHGMHAQCPWFVTWDDHEFDNNYANDIQEEQPKGKEPADPVDFLVQRAAAYQAYYEFMPLRPQSLPHGPDMRLYRKAHYGSLADFYVLDTRQYRTDQPNRDGLKPLNDEALRKTNTMLGRKQKGWLQAALISSNATWNVLAQQVMMAMVRMKVGPWEGYSMDQWPGYAYERMELIRFLQQRRVPNPVVLTGDIHSNWANELRVDDREPDSPVVATEFVTTSISSEGNGPKTVLGLDKLLADNPGVKFHDRQRGYVRCTVTPQHFRADFVQVPDVTQPGGAVITSASFVVEKGQAKIQKAG